MGMNNHREVSVTVRTTNKGLHNNNNNNPYVYLSPFPAASNRPNTMDTICKKVEAATRQAENMVDNIWNHIRMSASPTDAAMARIVQGTKVLTNGGSEKLFQHTFGVFPGEKLLKQYACYISTTSGPVIGTLYITTKRLAFCSDNPLCHHPFSLQLQHQCTYYKVVVQLEQVRTVSPSTNRFNTKEKYTQIITVDGYEFYFMGFVSYDKALKTMNEALQQYGNYYSGKANGQLL